MSLSPALSRTLAAGRPSFNARVAAARRERPGFDTAALAEAIREWLDPVVAALETVSPDRVPAVVDAGFDLILGLTGHGIAGDRRALVDRVWRRLGPAFAASVAVRPYVVLAMLTNAALTIAATPGARVDDWIERMAGIAPLVDADTLAAAGQVVAWRSGMAHFRAGAIAAADGLPDALAVAAVGASGHWADVRAALSRDPWWTPERGATPGIDFGGFTSFGGPFAEPPTVKAGAQGFFVRSGERTSLLVADAWGATLHPASADEFDAADGGTAVLVDGGRVAAGDRTIAVDLPAEGLSAVATATSIVVASPYSHYLRIEPWRLP